MEMAMSSPLPDAGRERISINDPSSEHGDLVRMRTRLLLELVDELGRDRRKEIVATIRALDEAIATRVRRAPETPFGRFKDVRSAIKQHLCERGSAAPPEEIVEALWQGGFRREPVSIDNPSAQQIEEHTRTRIRKSLGFHLNNPRGILVHLFREEHGLVGLWDWEAERFER
jgi:hypothetical protein